jgi:hypothetical protein
LDVEAPAGDAPATAPSAVPATTAPTRRNRPAIPHDRRELRLMVFPSIMEMSAGVEPESRIDVDATSSHLSV